MDLESADSMPAWIRDLPHAQVQFPRELHNRAKFLLWKMIRPIHPYVREGVVRLGIMHPEKYTRLTAGRQNFLIGTLAPDVRLADVALRFIERGYGSHQVAWKDRGEILSLRLVENFAYQYHVRFFEDGEVRGHYEYTPECFPFSHLKTVGQEDRRELFYEHLGDLIIPANI